MKKTEIKKATDRELIIDFINTYSSFVLNANAGRGITKLLQHGTDLGAELVARNILLQEDIDKYLNL